jgi:5'-nucleotidase
MLHRRKFLQLSAKAAALLPVLGLVPRSLLAASKDTSKATTLTVLHTNDVHSRIEPFPANAGRNAGKGGVARRLTLIEAVRQQEPNTLLLDAGDYFQGTPYFNLYQGKLEIELMSKLGYDAATLGNHDFDAGLEVLAQRIREASFPVVICNYDLAGTPVAGLTKEYITLKKGGLKIGIYGVGIKPQYWIATPVAKQIKHKPPVPEAQRVERLLKDAGCDLIICLSHLGLTSRYAEEPGDPEFAAQTRFTDLIIGGHTHTFMAEPKLVSNLEGRQIMINQVGWAGINLGRVDFTLQSGTVKAKGGSSPVE